MSAPFQLDRAASFRSLGDTVTCNAIHLSPSIHSCPGPHDAIPTKPVDDLLPVAMMHQCPFGACLIIQFWSTSTFSLCAFSRRVR
jgi:hypothetical protein